MLHVCGLLFIELSHAAIDSLLRGIGECSVS